MHRHWALPSGDEARDEIRRRVLFPRELERYKDARNRPWMSDVFWIRSSRGSLEAMTWTIARATDNGSPEPVMVVAARTIDAQVVRFYGPFELAIAVRNIEQPSPPLQGGPYEPLHPA
ncbi:GF15049, partial [Streptomyces azureus]